MMRCKIEDTLYWIVFNRLKVDPYYPYKMRFSLSYDIYKWQTTICLHGVDVHTSETLFVCKGT